MIGFGSYLESLLGSWESLAVPHSDAVVVRDARFLASVSPSHPVLNNVVLLDAGAVHEACSLYRNAGDFAVWSHQEATAQALQNEGFVRADTTYPMACQLDLLAVTQCRVQSRVDDDVPVEHIAALNGVEEDLLVGVPGVRAYATEGLEAGAVLMEVGSDVNVSFVATRPEHRRKGFATAVLAHALRQAQRDGFRTSSLQATTVAHGVYQRLGYHRVGTWQEWKPASG